MDQQALLGFLTITWGTQPHEMISVILAKWLGLFLVITSIFTLVKQDDMRNLVEHLKKSRTLQMVSGAMAVFIGSFFVSVHSTFSAGWPLLITLFGYLVLLRGLFRLFFPQEELKLCSLCGQSRICLFIWSFVWLVIGLIFLWLGYLEP